MAETVLWGILWRDETISLLTASDRRQACDRASDPARSRAGGRRRNGRPTTRNIWPVSDFEMRAGPRSRLNEPLFYRLVAFTDELVWFRPDQAFGWTEDEFRPEKPESHAGTLWSLVWRRRGLFVFAAGSVEEASRRVVESGPRWGIAAPDGPALVEIDLKPVERLELHLAPPDRDSAPTCYRMWIDGREVGWQSPGPDDDSPLAEAARMPVPRACRVNARARRSHRATGRARHGPSATDL